MPSIYSENVKFICARPFDSEYGHHNPGEVVEEAPTFHLLETLVHAGLLYPYCPEEGYAYLPPHVFSALNTRSEVQAKLDRDPSRPQLAETGPKAQAQKASEKEAELQQVTYEAIKRSAEKKAERQQAPKPAEEKSVADVVAKKTAAKKTASTKENKNV